MSRALVHRRLNRTPPPGYRLLMALAAMAVFSFAGCSTAVVGGVGAGFALITRDLPNPSELSSRPLAQVTQLYDRTGTQLLYEFYEERRIAIPLKDVAPVMIQATLAAEDVNFYQHPGFDIRGLARALLNELHSSGEHTIGGSTITQQLVKRTFLTDEKSYVRKLKELILAVQVEQSYSKDQILEMYLNQVFYGNQSYGVEAAALSYFGKHARDLNLAEASLLAGLVQAPSEYDPLINSKAALRRQAEVLDVMVRYGMITPEDAAVASEQASHFTYRQQPTTLRAPHFAFYVKEQLQQQVNPQVLRNGLKVITTLDLGMQDTAQEIVARRVRQLAPQHVNNGSLVAINPRTGEILAMVGSADYFNQAIDGQVNVATALRQPGSSFKAFTYTTAFATKKYVPATTVIDQPISRPDPGSKTGVYRPVNYDGKFHGAVSLRSALDNSYNIPAVLVQEAVGGAAPVIKTARAMGITTDLPEVMSLTLGAGSVRLLDMASAYGVLANGGVRVPPTPFLKIEDSQGHTIYELTPKGEPVVEPQVAYMMSDVLSDNPSRYPMFGTVLDLAGGRTAAVKTGTTNDYKDSLTIGYTPSLVTGVWVGNTDNSPMYQVAGSLGAGYIWKEFMDTVLKGKPNEKFDIPAGVVRTRVCGYIDLMITGTTPSCSLGPAAAAPQNVLPQATLPPPRPTPVLPPR